MVEFCKTINSFASEFPKTIRLNRITANGMKHLIEKMDIGSSFAMISNAYSLLNIEPMAGKFAAPVIVEALDFIGENCHVVENVVPLITFERLNVIMMDINLFNFFYNMLVSL